MELTVDTASADMAGVALSQEGALLAEITWRCQRNHSAELLPTVQRLLAQASADEGLLRAVFVCVGPGSYTGLRVGVAVAKGLAFALELPLVGVGRLEADAYQHAAYPGPVCAVHRAGRGELAWAVYRGEGDAWREEAAPRLTTAEEMLAQAPPDALFCGEVDDDLRRRLAGRPVAVGAAAVRRAATLAELGWRRLREGQGGDSAAVRPIYLREAVARPPAWDR